MVSSPADLQIDRDELWRAVKLLNIPDGLCEVRTLGNGPIRSGLFDDPVALRNEVARIQRADGVKGIYYGLNPPKSEALRGRALNCIIESRITIADKDIDRRRLFALDFDPERPSDIPATDAEHEAALQVAADVMKWLQEAIGFPSGLLADSGNGGQLIFPIDLPNDAETSRMIGDCLEAVKRHRFPETRKHPKTGAQLTGFTARNGVAVKCDTTIGNPARIFRLPGTWNCKGQHTPERPWRPARILEAPYTLPVVKREVLERLADLGRPQATDEALDREQAPRLDMKWGKLADGIEKMRAWIEHHLGDEAIKSEKDWTDSDGLRWWMFILSACPFDPEHNRGEVSISITDGNIRHFRCHHNSCHDQNWQALRKHLGDIPPSRVTSGEAKAPRLSLRVLEAVAATPHELFHSTDGLAFIAIEEGGRRETYMIEGKACENWLRCLMGDTPLGAEAVREIQATLAARAMRQGKEHRLNLRTGRDEATDARYLDLANEAGEIVAIERSGPDGPWHWHIVSEAPVRFYRSPNQAPLPRPIRGGNLEALRQFINCQDDEWPLIVGLLCDALKGRGPYHVASVSGRHGTGKTQIINLCSQLLDPLREAQTSAPPKNETDLAVMGLGQFVVALENLSHINADLSDAFCRLATGSGLRTRKLYTNFDQVAVGCCRPVWMDGISENIHAADLLDRTILLTTKPLERTRQLAELRRAFREQHAAILGGLLDIIVAGLNIGQQDSSGYTPRMMDCYAWMYQCAAAMPYGAEGFKAAYQAKRNEAKTAAFESSPIAAHFVQFVRWWIRTERKAEDKTLRLTSQELFDEFMEYGRFGGVNNPHWPQSPRGLTARLRKDSEALEAKGIIIKEPDRSDRLRLYAIQCLSPTDSEAV